MHPQSAALVHTYPNRLRAVDLVVASHDQAAYDTAMIRLRMAYTVPATKMELVYVFVVVVEATEETGRGNVCDYGALLRETLFVASTRDVCAFSFDIGVNNDTHNGGPSVRLWPSTVADVMTHCHQLELKLVSFPVSWNDLIDGFSRAVTSRPRTVILELEDTNDNVTADQLHRLFVTLSSKPHRHLFLGLADNNITDISPTDCMNFLRQPCEVGLDFCNDQLFPGVRGVISTVCQQQKAMGYQRVVCICETAVGCMCFSDYGETIGEYLAYISDLVCE
jgi:hypothetical protein